ncbi:MAG: chromosome segregation protein SMC [bacterium]|nr:MAG: chromosome segregation protein SMC [bacterium]
MYLSKLDIFGFKSFAQKVSFRFEDGITAIIGPNGCGKSNIVDAIRWVLGEQKPSLLRLDKMENLIFNGTAVRKPLSMVEVSILIENTKNILPSLYTEVKITRRLYRSGESEYLLNNRQVRLKDIIDLFADTGMGSDAYSVIELKMVEQILSDNAEERRRLFEEAAGIKKYKFRRKSAIRKLETTDQELVRLNDVISEVQKTVNSLSRQVGKARRYHQYKNELKQKEIYIYQYRDKRYGLDLIPLREEFSQVRQTRERLGKEVNLGEAELEKLQVKSVDLEKIFREVSGRLTLSDNKIRDIQQKVQLNEQKIESFRENCQERQTEIAALEKRLADYATQIISLEKEVEKNRGDLSQKEKVYQENSHIEKAAEDKLDQIRQQFQEFRQKNQSRLEEIRIQREEIQRINIERDNFLRQREKLTLSVKNLEEQLEQKQSSLSQIEIDLKKAQEERNIFLQEISRLEKRGDEIELQTNRLEEEKNQLLGQLEKENSRSDFLKNLIENYEGFSESIQYIMSQKNNYKGLIDILANMVHTREEFRPALESYLEDISNYLVVEGEDTARSILSEIRKQKKGRLTLIPLSLLNNNRNSRPEHKDFDGDVKFLKDIVQYDKQYEKLFGFLFDRVVLVEDMETALRYHHMNSSYRFLTREGELVGEWGHMTGGNSHRSINLTGRKAQYESVVKKVRESGKQLQKISEKLEQVRQEQSVQKERRAGLVLQEKEQEEQVNLLEKRRDFESYEFKNLEARLLEQREEITSIQSQLMQIAEREKKLQPVLEQADRLVSESNEAEADLTSEMKQADENFRRLSRIAQEHQITFLNQQNQMNERIQKIGFLKQSDQETRERINAAQTEMNGYSGHIEIAEKEIKSARSELEILYRGRDAIEQEKNEVENNYQSLKSLILSREEEIKKLHRRWNQALERLKELELKMQEIEIKQKSQKEQFEEQYGSELDEIVAENPLPENPDIQQIQEELVQLRHKIENLGEVNPLAVKEYDKEKGRLDFLKEQQEDLLEAKAELLETINKLNKTARGLFLETFEQIGQNFRGVFGKFFEGGQAELQLIENEDPLESNIDISVHIKGRKLTTLNLMSAGEKTLTAISLLFAIYLYKPSPFCILDEVDAPLDDVNIARYTHALKEFSDNTQFILVTHNKMTMQAAQAMYGITMEEPGISKVVSVRFD